MDNDNYCGPNTDEFFGRHLQGLQAALPDIGKARTQAEWEAFMRSALLPTEAAARKAIPIATGFVDYFPDAMAEVARASLAGNKQHLDGQPLHWDKSKSQDEADAAMRHFIERGTFDTDGIRHSAKFAWRAMALLQREIDAERLLNKQPTKL
jgi:hypothetical protein